MRGFEDGFTIPVGVYDPLRVYQIFEAIASWAGDETHLQNESVLMYLRYVLPTEGDVQRALYISQTIKSDLGMVVPRYDWILGSFADALWHEDISIPQAIDLFRDAQQDLIDQAFAGSW
jgi:hypothetical protein